MSTFTITEPRTYAPDSPHSFFRDLGVLAAIHHPDHAGAQKRMDRHTLEIGEEIKRRSPEGLRALNVVRQRTRNADELLHRKDFDAEVRAMTAGSGSGGSFVTPVYLADQWVPALDVEPSFVRQCNELPLPAWGMSIYVPQFASGSTAAVQESAPGTGEGATINLDGPDPISDYVEANVETLATGVEVSVQVSDRGGPPAFDGVVYEQLQRNVNAKLDGLALGIAATNGQTTAGYGPASAGAFFADVASAHERARVSGVRARTTHVFVPDSVLGFLGRQTTSTGAPILPAQDVPGSPPWAMTGDDDAGKWSGYTGRVLPTGELLYVNDNLSGQVLVSRPSTVIVATGDPVYRATQTGQAAGGAPDLSVTLEAYQYAAVICRIGYANQFVTNYGSAH